VRRFQPVALVYLDEIPPVANKNHGSIGCATLQREKVILIALQVSRQRTPWFALKFANIPKEQRLWNNLLITFRGCGSNLEARTGNHRPSWQPYSKQQQINRNTSGKRNFDLRSSDGSVSLVYSYARYWGMTNLSSINGRTMTRDEVLAVVLHES